MSKRIKIGDIVEVPLKNGRKTYIQYVDENNGSIVKTFNYAVNAYDELNLDNLRLSDQLFPPIHVGLKDPIKSHQWKIVANLPVEKYQYKGFLSWHPELSKSKNEPVKIKSWFLWTGKEYKPLGKVLPMKYMNFESDGVYSADMFLDKIETGRDSFQHAKKANEFPFELSKAKSDN